MRHHVPQITITFYTRDCVEGLSPDDCRALCCRVVNLEAHVSELTCAINQMKLDVEEAKLRETKYGEEIRMLLDAVASHETDASARNAIYSFVYFLTYSHIFCRL